MQEKQIVFAVAQKNRPVHSVYISEPLFANVLLNLCTAVKSSWFNAFLSYSVVDMIFYLALLSGQFWSTVFTIACSC